MSVAAPLVCTCVVASIDDLPLGPLAVGAGVAAATIGAVSEGAGRRNGRGSRYPHQ